jgi:hypothetical protein
MSFRSRTSKVGLPPTPRIKCGAGSNPSMQGGAESGRHKWGGTADSVCGEGAP